MALLSVGVVFVGKEGMTGGTGGRKGVDACAVLLRTVWWDARERWGNESLADADGKVFQG